MASDKAKSALLDLDDIDWQIIRVVQRDGRISNSKLAVEVGLSETPCWRRWKRLEDNGLIREYRAILDRQKFGYSVVCFTEITFVSHAAELTNAFEDLMQELDWVLMCHNITGTVDVIIQMIAKDLDEFRDRLNFIRRQPNVHSVQTQISVKQVKDTTSLPVQ